MATQRHAFLAMIAFALLTSLLIAQLSPCGLGCRGDHGTLYGSTDVRASPRVYEPPGDDATPSHERHHEHRPNDTLLGLLRVTADHNWLTMVLAATVALIALVWPRRCRTDQYRRSRRGDRDRVRAGRLLLIDFCVTRS